MTILFLTIDVSKFFFHYIKSSLKEPDENSCRQGRTIGQGVKRSLLCNET